MSHPRISVLVATADRPRLLAGCLESLAVSTFTDAEVLVLDQSLVSTEPPPAPGAGKGPAIEYLRCPRKGKSAALNLGIARARGALLAFTDDDCLARRDWVEAIARAYVAFALRHPSHFQVMFRSDAVPIERYPEALKNADDAFGALDVLGEPKAVDAEGGPAPGVEAGGLAATDTPVSEADYTQCGWMWATQSLPDISVQVQSALDAAGLPYRSPEGAYYIMADFGDLDWPEQKYARADWTPDRAFAEYMARDVGVAVVPGSSFYAGSGAGDGQGRTRVRVNFAKREETLREAARRLQRLSA